MKLTNQLLLGLVLVLVLVSLVDAFTVENKITGHFVDTITGSFTETITGSFAESLSASFDVDNFPPEIQVALEFIGDAGDLVTILVNTSDANDDTVYVNYSSPLNSSGQWQSTVNDYGIHYALITAFDYSTQSNQTIAIKLRPYCGDLSCDYHAIGETCTSCPEDCGICPETPPSGGGGGGSSKIIELEEEISRLKNQTPSASQFEIISNELYIELQKDEFQGQQIRIKNNLDKDLFLTTKVHGGIIGSLFFDSQKIKIPANNQEIFDFIALANKPEGTYEGILTFESEDTYQTISIIIKIIPKIEIPVESLDLSVN